MRPGDDSDAELTDVDEFDAWRALQKATDQPRADIIADIVGHPKGAPSVRELNYMNPSLSADSIRRHLHVLQEVEIARELVVEPGDRIRDYPYKFYALTDDARELFDRNGLFPEAAWEREYDSVEKTDKIKELERIPRPSE